MPGAMPLSRRGAFSDLRDGFCEWFCEWFFMAIPAAGAETHGGPFVRRREQATGSYAGGMTMVVPTHSARTMPGGTLSRRIDVGGRSLAIECSGSGSPTVVLESGLGAESVWWEPVQDAVARFTQVCRFDRA